MTQTNLTLHPIRHSSINPTRRLNTLRGIALCSLIGLTGLWGCGGPAPVRQPGVSPEVSPGMPTQPGARIEPEVLQAPTGTPPAEDPARELIKSGRYLDAALLLIDLANTLPPPHRQDYQLRVASLLLQGNYIVQAEQILSEVDINGLGRNFQLRKSLLNAQLLLAKQSPQQAAAVLNPLAEDINSADTEQQKEYYRTRMDVYAMLSDYISSAQARVMLNPMLSDRDELIENQEALLRDLQNLAPEQLRDLEMNATIPAMKVWAGLAYVVSTARDLQQARQMIDDWQSRFPSNDVQDAIINTVVAQQPEALGRPTQVALILPMSGKFAKAAEAIRNGFLAAYYAQSSDTHRPIIRLYDETDDANQIQAIYQQAINDGANFVVGPLNKQAVTNLYNAGVSSSGILSLNYGDTEGVTSANNNFFQMSLSPEQEAVHVAEHAWLDGHKQAAAIFPNTSWGERVYAAFKDRWEELGGSIVEYQTYDMRNSDYSDPIKQLLNIDESEKRYNDIRSLVREKLEFEPRRRKDVDFIFMAAFARQGRLLRPQLKFHHASNIPVYATSHVYGGISEPQMDRDMNGVRFSDMPWTLTGDTKHSGLKKEIENTFPSSSKRYMRLYALGIDAYNIIPELNRLRRNRFASYPGETGTLYLDVSNRLQRKLLWAQFQAGLPKVIQKF